MHRSDAGAVAAPVGSAEADGAQPEQVSIPFVLMRGGTSKAVFLNIEDLPADRAAWEPIVLSLFGSPDPRQIDGLGGADLLTSKLAVIGPPTRDDADLDYTFAQVSITEPVVDYDINCGNISAAVGAYAIEERFVRPTDPVTLVRIHNTNIGRVLLAEVPVLGGHPVVDGDEVVDGVPGTGAPIVLDYADAVGGATGSLFPTGRQRDALTVPGLGGEVEASIVDIGNLCVFFPASSADVVGTEGPSDLSPGQLARFVAVKEAAAALLDLASDGLVPIPVAVSPPAPYACYGTGRPVSADDVDIVARVVGGRPPVMHKAFPGTASVTTAVAAMIDGTTVAAAARPRGDGEPVRVGHPSGVVTVWATVNAGETGWSVERAAYTRTARRLAEGRAFVRQSVFPD